ncbi:hypothetical protein T4B_7947 [Trichinella pseudospiralis]|uniref:Uncharacterized protein n=1 Tax=Trichinella pseudospiralis TaxID=6337 RepID=A0A0V1GLQ1_TRIPS|nr:hypothetical protein T4B_7947 [Trichinella pseudospiralis]
MSCKSYGKYCKYEVVLQKSTVILSIRLPSGEETTSSADRSDRSVEGGSGVLIHPGSSQRKS